MPLSGGQQIVNINHLLTNTVSGEVFHTNATSFNTFIMDHK